MSGMTTVDIDEVFEKVILMWCYAKLRNPTSNPAQGIYFAVTDRLLPRGAEYPNNAIDLCDAIGGFYGYAPMNHEERVELSARAVVMFENVRQGRGAAGALQVV